MIPLFNFRPANPPLPVQEPIFDSPWIGGDDQFARLGVLRKLVRCRPRVTEQNFGLGCSRVVISLHDEGWVAFAVADEDATIAYPCLSQLSFDRFRRELISIAEDLDIIQSAVNLERCVVQVHRRIRIRIR